MTVQEPDYGTSSRAITLKNIDDVKYIRITDFGEDGIELDHEFTSVEDVDDRYFLSTGDILFARSGATVGKTYLYTGDIGVAVFAGYCIRFRFNEHLVLPEFVYFYTKTPRYKAWVQSMQRPSGQPNINKEEFKSFTLPLPDLHIQRGLVTQMEASRAERRRNMAEADKLLGTMDRWLLGKLGIVIPMTNHQGAFAARLADAHQRVDVAFHSPRFRSIREQIEHGTFPVHALSTICVAIQSGFAAGKQNQADDSTSGVPHLRPLNLNIYGEISLVNTKYVPPEDVNISDYCKQGEVLFNNTNSEQLVGKSAVFDLDVPCACSNHMTRLTLQSNVNPYYISAMLNALRHTGYLGLIATNFVNQAGINTETLARLIVPLPDSAIQNQIVIEVQKRRDEAHRLRAASEANWNAAKAYFEAQLLGGGDV